MGCLRRFVMVCCLGVNLLAFAFILLALLNAAAHEGMTVIGKTDAEVMFGLSLIGLILWLSGSGGRGPARARIQELERQNQRLRDALHGSSDLATEAVESHGGTDSRSIG